MKKALALAGFLVGLVYVAKKAGKLLHQARHPMVPVRVVMEPEDFPEGFHHFIG